MAESLPSEWARQMSSDGRAYYYHRTTRETRWHLPEDLQRQVDSQAERSETPQVDGDQELRVDVDAVVAGIFERLRARQARLAASQEADAALNPPAFDESAVAPTADRAYEKPWLTKRIPTPQLRSKRRSAKDPAPGEEKFLQRAEMVRQKFMSDLESRPDVGGHGLCPAGSYSAREGWNFSTQLPRERPRVSNTVLAHKDTFSHQPAPRTVPPPENVSQEAIYAMAADVQQRLAEDQRLQRKQKQQQRSPGASPDRRRQSFFGLYDKQGNKAIQSVRASRRANDGAAAPPPTPGSSANTGYDPEIPALVQQLVQQSARDDAEAARQKEFKARQAAKARAAGKAQRPAPGARARSGQSG